MLFGKVVILRFTEFHGLQDEQKKYPQKLTPGRYLVQKKIQPKKTALKFVKKEMFRTYSNRRAELFAGRLALGFFATLANVFRPCRAQ